MDRETILRELAQIEERIARTRREMENYQGTISRLEQVGRDSLWAQLMLHQCEEVLALHLTVQGKLIDRLSRPVK